MRSTMRRVGLALVALTFITALGAARATTASARPWLGVYTQEITGDLRDGMELPDAGVLVNRIVPNGPAARAGIEEGDVIVRLDSHPIESPQALSSMVGDARERQVVRVEVLRHGERRTFAVTLGTRPADDAPDAPEAPTPPAPPAPGGDDGNGRHMRVKILRDGEQPQQFDLHGGDLDQLPGHVREMLRDVPGLDGNGGLQALRMMGGSRGRLGVRIESLSPDLAAALGAPGDDGVLVLEVIQDTPAERAGLRAGDVILTVDGKDVKDSAALVGALRDVDGKVSITVSRKGARRTIEAELASAPSAPSAPRKRIVIRGNGPDAGDDIAPPGVHRKIIIRGDGPGAGDGDDVAPRVERELRVRGSGDADVRELRQQVDELRRQVRELSQKLQGRQYP